MLKIRRSHDRLIPIPGNNGIYIETVRRMAAPVMTTRPYAPLLDEFSATVAAFNTLRSTQDGRHLPDDIFKCIFLNENVWGSIRFSLTFLSNGPINNIRALVQIMAWRRPGDKLLSEPMMVILLMNLWSTRPQWVNNRDALSLHRISEMDKSLYLYQIKGCNCETRPSCSGELAKPTLT